MHCLDLLLCEVSVYYPGPVAVEGNDQADRWARQPLQVACVSEDLKCWGAWDTGLDAKPRTYTVGRLEERSVERGSAQQSWKDVKGPSSIRPTLELSQRQHWVNFWEMGWNAYRLPQGHRYHLELNWCLELNSSWECNFIPPSTKHKTK